MSSGVPGATLFVTHEFGSMYVSPNAKTPSEPKVSYSIQIPRFRTLS